MSTLKKSISQHNTKSIRKLRCIWILILKKMQNFWKPLSPLQGVTSFPSADCPRMFEFVEIKNVTSEPNSDLHCYSKIGLWFQLFLTQFLIFQAPLHFLVSGLTGNEVPKYYENGCACGEAGLAEEMETWAKSWASQILKRSVAWFPDQQGSDRFWIAAKPLEAFQNELNIEVCPLSRNTAVPRGIQ